MKPLALGFIALLLFSIISLLPAYALSPITFTTETQITSQGEQFQQFYENGTSSVVALDANSTGSYFMDAWDGTTLTSLDEQLTNTTYTVDSHAYISPVDLSRYSIQFDGSTEYAQAANNGVYDVTTEDFWTAGMFKRTSDSGGIEMVVSKLPGNGYDIRIDASDRLVINYRAAGDGTTLGITITTTTVGTNKWYAWAVNFDRDGSATLYLYDIDTATLYSNSASISTRTGSLTNADTFTVARRSNAADRFFPGHMDNLIPPQIGETITQEQFVEFATTGLIGSPASWYDMNDGMGETLVDMAGSNTLTLFNTPTWSSDVADSSTSRPTIYVTGRDSDNSTNGVGKWNLADLSEVDDEYFSTMFVPAGIAQTTGSIFTAGYNASIYNAIFLAESDRDFTNYSESLLYNGTAGTPAAKTHMVVDGSTTSIGLNNGGNTAVGELAGAGSVLIGDELNAIGLYLRKAGSPPGIAEVGVMKSATGDTIDFACDTLDPSTLATNFTLRIFYCPSGYEIEENDIIGIKYDDGDGSNRISVDLEGGNPFDGTASRSQTYSGSWANTGGTNTIDVRGNVIFVNARIIAYESDQYVFFQSGDNLRVVKDDGTLLGTSIANTYTSDYSLVQLTDRIIIQTATDTYQLLTATDAITEIHPNSFNTRYAQTFEIAPSARTFNTNAMYVANATYATNYTPDTGANARTGVFIDDVNTGGSGTIEAFDPTKYYYLSENDLTVEASATTWTIKDVGTKEQVEIEAYTEALGIDLLENTTSILAEDVIKLVCDNGDYLIEIQYFAVGSDADCNTWKTLDQSSATTGRMLPYATAAELVHTSTYTDYAIQLSVGDPSLYQLTTIYDTLDIDTGAFDSGGNTEQHFLLGQCYVLQVVEESTGNTLQTGVICAGQIDPITISLSGIVIPDDWLRSTWSYSIQRNYTDNGVLFTFQKSVSPYNGSLYVTDNFDAAEATFSQWYNFTEVSGASIANVTGTTSNMTLYFTLYENGTPVINAVSNAEVSIDNPFSVANFGLLFGVPLAFIFPVLTAAMFPKSLAYFGSIVTVAVIGIMSIFGYITLPIWFWAIIMPVLAFAIFVGHKR